MGFFSRKVSDLVAGEDDDISAIRRAIRKLRDHKASDRAEAERKQQELEETLRNMMANDNSKND